MILPIYTYNDDILRQQAQDVEKNKDISKLIIDMFETMYNAKGVGLAAPQVGISKKIIIIEEELTRKGIIFKGVFVNPKILNYKGYLTPFSEGCLSFPGLDTTVYRPLTIEVEWYDENWEYHKETLQGIKSRILQHEIDHLNGILFVDRIHLDERLKIYMKLEDIRNKKVK